MEIFQNYSPRIQGAEMQTFTPVVNDPYKYVIFLKICWMLRFFITGTDASRFHDIWQQDQFLQHKRLDFIRLLGQNFKFDS